MNFYHEVTFSLNEWELLLQMFSHLNSELPIQTLLGKFANWEFSRKKMIKRISKIERQELISTDKI